MQTWTVVIESGVTKIVTDVASPDRTAAENHVLAVSNISRSDCTWLDSFRKPTIRQLASIESLIGR